MEAFVGFNNVPDEGMNFGDGVYINANEIAAFEGRFDAGRNVYTIVHLKSGTQFKILGKAYFMLDEAAKSEAKQRSATSPSPRSET